MSRIEKLIQRSLNRVPGYTGYRDKEDRRDEDKRVRDQVAAAIVAVVDQLSAYNAQVAAARQLDLLKQLESEVGQIRLLADRVRHASYGYGGIFTDDGIDAAAIEQLRLFDAALLLEVDSLAAAATALTQTVPPAADALATVTSERHRLTTLFNSRAHVVDQGKPTSDEQALKLLEIPAKVEPSPLLAARKGDALSVLGDNYIVGAEVALHAAAGDIVLLRVASDPSGATWLLGTSIPEIVSAKLIEAEAASAPTATLASATASITSEQGNQQDIAARYAYTDLGDNRVGFTLALGDSIVTYTGTRVDDKDIEVYSAGSA